MDTEPTDEEIQLTANLLAKFHPGFLPFPIFHEITRLTTTPIIEIVPLRRHDDIIEILLLEREADDPVWPGKLHTPGTVIRATDSLESALERILSKELNNVEVSKPKFVTNILHHSGRGMEASQIYFVDVFGETAVGHFYDTNHLPDSLVESQRDFMPQAVEAYKKNGSKS